MEYASLLLLLVAVHFVCDFPLQGDYLSKAKADGPYPTYHLFGHSIIHGGGVYLVTGFIWLGIIETLLHMVIDRCKINGYLGYGKEGYATDQLLHLLCKIAYAAIIILFV